MDSPCTNCGVQHIKFKVCPKFKAARTYTTSEKARNYINVHTWNLRNWTKTGKCEFCREEAQTQWSNKSGKYIRGDRNDWQELCFDCHFEYDHGIRPKKGNAHNQEYATYTSVIDGLEKRVRAHRFRSVP